MVSGHPPEEDQPYRFDVTAGTGICVCEQHNYFKNMKASQPEKQQINEADLHVSVHLPLSVIDLNTAKSSTPLFHHPPMDQRQQKVHKNLTRGQKKRRKQLEKTI